MLTGCCVFTFFMPELLLVFRGKRVNDQMQNKRWQFSFLFPIYLPIIELDGEATAWLSANGGYGLRP